VTVTPPFPTAEQAPSSTTSPRPVGRLGLSLAGGGFRASLFHLGVLRRLAELDVLRRVEVLSTVSGGSITGALYVVLLKKYLEDPGRVAERDTDDGRLVGLPRKQYEALLDELEGILVAGVQKNLRTRVIMNPLGVLGVMLTGDSLGRRMARLYERHLFSRALVGLNVTPPSRWRPAWLWPGQIRLRDLVMEPAGEKIREGIAAFNARQRAGGGSAVTRIAINATSLNSGGRFSFSAVEIGDWYLGYFRESEFDLLLARKALLALDDAALAAVARGGDPPAQAGPQAGDRAYAWSPGEAADAAALVLHRRGNGADGGDAGAGGPSRWDPLYAVPDFPGQLEDAAFGLLRPAKVAAWYLRVGARREPAVMGGRTPAQHAAALWVALRNADPDLESLLRGRGEEDGEFEGLVADYVLELYYQRSAERVSANIAEDWGDIRVGHAVGASACFPPVFPPFLLFGLYDDLHVPRLGLTDGRVYDNMGVTALIDEGCTEIIASDTGGLFRTTPASTNGHVGLALRVPDLLMRTLGGVQRSGLRERRRVSRTLADLASSGDEAEPTPLQKEAAAFREQRALDELVYFHIASARVEPADPRASEAAVPALKDIGIAAQDVASLRTDLDGFGDVEVTALVNHGYDTADRYMRRYAPAMVDASAARLAPRMPRAFTGDNASPRRSALILRVGASRFFRALKLRAAVAWSFSVAAAVAVVNDAFGWLNSIAGIIPGVAATATGARVLIPALLALGAVWLLWSVGRRPAAGAGRGRDRPGLRRVRTALKWARALRGNLLWPLLALPAVIAAAVSALATISWLFFHLPFMRATRLEVVVGRVGVGAGVDGAAAAPGGAAELPTSVAPESMQREEDPDVP
jgi:predicted acylesterase/phospholipase RssA